MATVFPELQRAPDLRAIFEDKWTLGALTGIIRKRRASFLLVVVSFMAAATLYCLLATPRYEATGQIQIQKDNAVAFGLDSSVMGSEAGTAADALDYNLSLETEVNILRSDSLALQVIRELDLETSRDFYPRERSGQNRPLRWLTFWKKPVEPMNVPLDRAPNRRYVVLKIFASHLKVEPVTGTRLISISYANPDPMVAADVVNHLINALIEYAFQTRFRAMAEASNWLTTQLDGLRKQTEESQTRAIALQRATGMFGEDESHNVMLSRLESLNDALSTTESNRILKEAVYHIAESGDPELISGLSGNATLGGTAPMANSLGLIQNLRVQQAAMRAELDQDRVRYGVAYPRIAELQGELGGIEKSIHDEVGRIRERAHTDYEIAARTETSAKAAFENQRKLVNGLNDKTTAYRLAKQEADGSREVYEGLVAKLKQAGVLEGLRSTNISIVNPARVPPPNHPKSPNTMLYFAAAIGAGFISGAGAVLFRELTDTKIRTYEELEKLTGVPLLGLIPAFIRGNDSDSERRLLPKPAKLPPAGQIEIPDSARGLFAEALRSLRTALVLPHSSDTPKVFLITSSQASEGKSTVSLSLATVLAQQGARVLLVDADLRRPILHERIGLYASGGLSAALVDGHAAPKMVESIPNLHAICGGVVPDYPSELLGSKRMRTLVGEWRDDYDFILLDGPPVLPVTDAIVLGQISDAILLVARHGVTEKKAMQRSYRAISRRLPQGTALGAVLNAVPARSSAFYEYYGYRGRPLGGRTAN